MARKTQAAFPKDHREKEQALEFEVAAEMSDLIRRVQGNKSKRTEKVLVKDGPIRVRIVALDEGGEFKDDKVDGPFTVQCLLGHVVVRVEGEDHGLSTGELLIVDAGASHEVTANGPSALLITIVRVGE